MCNLGDPLTAGEMAEILIDVPPETEIKLTSFDFHGNLLTFTVHRADYPVKSVLNGREYVWMSFDAHKEKKAR